MQDAGFGSKQGFVYLFQLFHLRYLDFSIMPRGKPRAQVKYAKHHDHSSFIIHHSSFIMPAVMMMMMWGRICMRNDAIYVTVWMQCLRLKTFIPHFPEATLPPSPVNCIILLFSSLAQ